MSRRHSAARGGLRHTHGSWLIKATLPLLVSIKEMTSHTPLCHCPNPLLSLGGTFYCPFSPSGETAQSLTLGICSGRQNSKTPYTVQPCATGYRQPRGLRKTSLQAGWRSPRKTTAKGLSQLENSFSFTFHSSKTLATVM